LTQKFINNFVLSFCDYWILEEELRTMALLFEGLVQLKDLESLEIFLPGFIPEFGQETIRVLSI